MEKREILLHNLQLMLTYITRQPQQHHRQQMSHRLSDGDLLIAPHNMHKLFVAAKVFVYVLTAFDVSRSCYTSCCCCCSFHPVTEFFDQPRPECRMTRKRTTCHELRCDCNRRAHELHWMRLRILYGNGAGCSFTIFGGCCYCASHIVNDKRER